LTTAGTTREAGTGRYTIHGVIASGPVATVHLGRLVTAAGSGKTVTIERLRPELATDRAFVEALLDEARLVSGIRHPRVVSLLDVLRDGDGVLLVREYAPGERLSEVTAAVLARGERFDPRVAYAVAVDVLAGLQAAHDANNEFGEPLGLVHRCFSPRAALVGVDGAARVSDLGFGKALGASGPHPNGRLAYMSPEQVRGATVTKLADVWAVGVVLWETLAGRPLFSGENDAAVTRNVTAAEVPDLCAASPGLPRTIDEVVRKALARAPGDRFPTARAMAAAIEQAAALALPSEVAAYLERASGQAIAGRAAEVQQIEASAPLPTAPAIIPSSEFIADTLWGHLAKPSSAPAEPAPAPPSPALATAPMTLVAPSALARAPGSATAAPMPTPARPAAPEPTRAPPPAPTRAPDQALPAASGPAPAMVPPTAPTASRRLRWLLPLGAILGLAAAILVAGPVLVPGFARGEAIEAAAARGVSLTIGGASGGYGGVHFDRLTASVPDVPGLAVAVASADVEIVRLRPTRVRLGHVDVTLDGPVLATLARVTLWYRGHGAARDDAATSGLRIDVPSASIAWTRALA
jgi:serine/threonine-protein kinase